MRKRDFFIAADINPQRLRSWIEAGWLCHGEVDIDLQRLSDIDLARAQLISDLQDELGVNDEGIEIILDLLDQLYGMRQKMREIVDKLRE
ncbi:MAG TPA: chaperone modulator CbpM [Aestuariivirgaceae bacterium]|jgi:chaperone modulatory protein CbpM